MKIFLVILFGTYSIVVWSQPTFLHSRPIENNWRIKRFVYQDDFRFYNEPMVLSFEDTSLACRWRFSERYLSYGLTTQAQFAPRKMWQRRIITHEAFQFSDTDYRISILPLVDFSAGKSSLKDHPLSINSRGFLVRVTAGSKLGLSTTFTENQAFTPEWVDSFKTATGILPGQGPVKPFKNSGYDFSYATGEINYKVSNHWLLSFGNERQFIGDGFRSMILSDQAAPFPYLKSDFNFGPVKYRYQIAQLQDRTVPSNIKPLPTKYLAFHYLDWDVNPKWKVGVYDAIIWAKISPFNGVNRGIDWNYMNPFVFFRPLEYNNRSIDNALLGFTSSYSIKSYWQVYGQLLLDEFKLSEWKKLNGSWTEKYAIQLGTKAHTTLGKNGGKIFGLFEFNSARPYTYSHQYPVQSYTHANASLAHPLGANFREELVQIMWWKNRWEVHVWATHALQGRDTTNGVSMGGNPLLNYNLRPQNYGVKIGQGDAQTIQQLRFSVAYIINPWNNLRLEATYGLRSTQSILFPQQIEKYWMLGIKTSIFNRSWDF